MLKNFCSYGLRALGYEIKKIETKSQYSIADQAIKNIVVTDKPIIFDVGANLGQSIDRFLSLYSSPTIHSFEPNPSTFEVLCKYNSHQNIFTNNFGLSDKSSVSPLFFGPSSKLDSLRKYNTKREDFNPVKMATKQHITENDLIEKINQSVEVRLETLQSYCETKKVEKIDILKIDTQSHELEVLQGAGAFLDKVSLIQIEIIFSDLYNASLTFYEIEKIIKPFGFRIVALPRVVNHKKKDWLINWVDAIYAKHAIIQAKVQN